MVTWSLHLLVSYTQLIVFYFSKFSRIVRAFNLVWDQLSENIRALYLNEDGERKEVGDIVTIPALADTLEAIAEGGADAFYMNGTIARSIIDTVNASGGIMTLEDLRTYAVKMEEPVQTQFNGKLKRDTLILHS